MDQFVEVAKNPSSEGVHHEIHLFFIICIFATMYGGAISAADGRLVFCHSCLPEVLLPFWSSLLALVPSWSSFRVFNLAFFWHSCSSRSWFYFVRHSTAVARVWTCLSRAVVYGSSLWLLLMVTIERVSTMQFFVWEAIVWLTRFPIDGAN